MLQSMADTVREDDFRDDDFVAKRIKITDVDTGNLVKQKQEEQNLDIHAVDGNVIKPTISMGQNVISVEGKLFGSTDKLIPESNKTSQDTLSCSSGEVHDLFVDNLCNIDAAAAEDKGSRHTMEDAWVVLPDASLEYPGKLRFVCFFFTI